MRRNGFYDSTAPAASHRVWKGGTRNEVKFKPIARRQAARLYHDARRFERQTRTVKNRQDGKLGRNGLAVLHALLFDFIDYVSGRLDPTLETIARAANISVRSVQRGLVKLKAAGVLGWTRRLHWEADGTIHQDSNAYALAETKTWQGYRSPAPQPNPEPGTWGDHPSTTPDDLVKAALLEGDPGALQKALELATDDGARRLLHGAMARLNKVRGEQ